MVLRDASASKKKLRNKVGQTEAQVVVGRCRLIRKWSHYTTTVDEKDEENRYIGDMGDQMVKKK